MTAGQRLPSRLAVDRMLDLHHLGAEAGQQLGAEGQRLHLLGGEDPHVVERLAELRRTLVGNVPQSHRGHRNDGGR